MVFPRYHNRKSITSVLIGLTCSPYNVRHCQKLGDPAGKDWKLIDRGVSAAASEGPSRFTPQVLFP